MNRTRMLMLAGFALLLSGAVTWLAYSILSPRFAPADDTIEVVVAREKITLGSRLEPSQLQVVQWPRAAAMDGSFSSVEDLADRGLIATVFTNEPILEGKLAPKGGVAGLTTAIPDGMRAVAVKVNDVIGVAGFALPGTRVDVILSGSPREGNETDTAKIFLENVQVLASGQNVEQDSNGQPQEVQVITLLVNPDDAQRLALASVDGRIQLALRNPLDLEPADPEAIVRRTLYERRGETAAPPVPTQPRPRAAPPAPAPPPPDPEPEPFTVDVFMGTDKQSITYEIAPE